MFIRDEGHGSAVLLLHGAPSPASGYEAVVERLRTAHRVLVPELPGYGRSPKLEPYSWKELRDNLVADLRARGVERMVVAGTSGGGHHALALAARADICVTGVVAIGSFAAFDDDNRTLLRGFVQMLREGPNLRSPELRGIMVQRMLSGSYAIAHPAEAEAAADWLLLTTADVLANELEQAASADLRDQLPGLRMPVLALVGEDDVACPVSCSIEIATLAPRGTLEVVPNAGHSLLVETPSLVLDRIAAIASA